MFLGGHMTPGCPMTPTTVSLVKRSCKVCPVKGGIASIVRIQMQLLGDFGNGRSESTAGFAL